MTLDEFNTSPSEEAKSIMQSCLGCANWADDLTQMRPFAETLDLIESGEVRWQAAAEDEILEAFSAHPQIGDLHALRNKYANTANAEQGQIVAADESVLLELQSNNQAYLDKFGFIFIVCATGKSAAEMLGLLNERLPNSRDVEMTNGANEQWKITLLRLDKLFLEEAA